jgi:hypothetical protein
MHTQGEEFGQRGMILFCNSTSCLSTNKGRGVPLSVR